MLAKYDADVQFATSSLSPASKYEAVYILMTRPARSREIGERTRWGK
jgi:hypothetical protein